MIQPRSGEKIVAQGVSPGKVYKVLESILTQGLRGCCPTRESQLPSSAEEGKADAVAAAGVVLVKKIIILICTIRLRSHPSSAEEGSCRPYVGQRPLTPWAKVSAPLRGYAGSSSIFL